MDNVKLLESAILVIRDRLGLHNAIVKDFRVLLDHEREGTKPEDENLHDIENTVRIVCKRLRIDYSAVLEQMNGGKHDWQSLLKEEEGQ